MRAFLTQVIVAAVGGLFLWVFIELKSMPGNIVDIVLFGIAIVDSIILTVLISCALTCFATVLALFKAYLD